MSHWEPIGEEDKTKKLEVESAKLIEYRYVYPSHAPPGRLVFTQQNLPPKGEQRAWHVYEKFLNNGRGMQWVCLPTLNGVSQRTEPLAGAPKEASLFACKPWLQDWHEHWTNIWRMWFLAGRRPQVQNVRQIWHEGKKALDPSRFNSCGRAGKLPQADFDLAIRIAPSGAEMYVGVTTHEISKKTRGELHGGLIAFWWSAPEASYISEVAEAVFFDICGLAETKEAAVDTPSPQSCAQPGGESSCQTLATQ